jgi:hypothetical protein
MEKEGRKISHRRREKTGGAWMGRMDWEREKEGREGMERIKKTGYKGVGEGRM